MEKRVNIKLGQMKNYDIKLKKEKKEKKKPFRTYNGASIP